MLVPFHMFLLPTRGVQDSFNDFLLMTLVESEGCRGIPYQEAVGEPGF